jgi:hypothetical protein
MFANGGAAVPNQFKGFSKLPEDVQRKMNPELAEKYEEGGVAGLMSQPDMAAMPMGSTQEMVDTNMIQTALEGASEEVGDLEQASDFKSMMDQFSGEEKSEEERRDDLASIVGEDDAAQTPDSVLALVTPVVQISMLEEGIAPMAQAAMDTPVEGDMAGGIMSMTGAGNEPPVNFNQGGEVLRRGDEDPVQFFANENTNRVAGFTLADLVKVLNKGNTVEVPTLSEAFEDKKAVYGGILGDSEEQKRLTQAQILFDIANTFAGFSGPMPGEKPGMSPAQRLLFSAQQNKLFPTIGARAAQLQADKRKLDLAALQSAEAEVAAAKKAEQALNLARIKNVTKPKSTSIYSPTGLAVPVIEQVTSTGVNYTDRQGKTVDFNAGKYKDYTLVKPDKVIKKTVPLYNKTDRSDTITGVEMEGEIYTDSSGSTKVDLNTYTTVKPDKVELKTDTFYLADKTPVPLYIKNGELFHATDFKDFKANSKFSASDPIYKDGSFDKPDKDPKEFKTQPWYNKLVTDTEVLKQYANDTLDADTMTKLNAAITAYLAGDRSVDVGGTVRISQPMLPPALKDAIIRRYKDKKTIPDAAVVYLQNTESEFDAGIINTFSKIKDGKHGGVDGITVDNVESIMLGGNKEPQLLEAQGFLSGIKQFFESIQAQIFGETTGSIDIYEVQEAKKILNGLALRTVEIQADLFEGNKLKAVMDMIIANSADIQGGTLTSDSELYNALLKNRKNLTVVLRDFVDVLQNKKNFGKTDVIKSRKGAKKVLNLIGEYTAFINLLEKQSRNSGAIGEIRKKNQLKSKFYQKRMEQIKKKKN